MGSLAYGKEAHMIEQDAGFPENVLGLRISGHVSREDYQRVVIPAVEAALKRAQKVNIYVQVDNDFSGLELGALWDDLKVGLGNFSRWERIAVVTDIAWIANALNVFGFLKPGQVEVFPLSDAGKARAWISETPAPAS
jgi:stage II sporulation SpoAA-like protein